MATTPDTLRAAPAPGYRPELAIALITVTLIALIATQPGFLVAALCVGLALTAVVNFDLFVCAMIFFLPWYPFLDWKFPLHDVFLTTRFLFLGVVAVRQINRGVSMKSWLWDSWFSKGAWLFAVVEIASLLLSDYRTASDPYPSLVKQLSYIAMFFAMTGWASTRDRIIRVFHIILVSTIGVCLFGFYQSLEGSFTGLFFRLYPRMEAVYQAQGGWSGRITSFLFHYNSLAGYLNTVAPLALGLAVLAKDQWQRGLGFVTLVFVGAAQYLTGSRGGLAGIGAVALVSVFYLAPRRKTVAVLLIASILAATLALTLAYEGDLEADRYKAVDDFTLESRIAIWGAATMVFLQYPVLGAGVGTFRSRFHTYVPGIRDDLDAHNLYLHTLAETGIIGFLLFFATMWGSFRCALSLRKQQERLGMIVGITVIGALAALMVHGLVDYIFLVSPQFGSLFWMLLGIGRATTKIPA